jgi:4-hydroxybenzoate polyprenyltransferase
MRPRLLAYAQLLRLPNVFTAFADILLGACAAGYIADRIDLVLLLGAASGCLYCGGMVWNDYFDRHDDAKTRPSRPIPSGRITPKSAVSIGIVLFGFGVIFAGLAVNRLTFKLLTSTEPLELTVALIAAILLYDGLLKRLPLGPLGMGACRFLNVMLGLSGAGGDPWTLPNVHLAAVVGVYIVGVTGFARTEEGTSRKRHLVYASLVMLAALGLAATLPAHRDPGTTFFLYPYLLVAFGFYVGLPISRAVQNPGPKQVQAAVKRCILGLVVLDAVLASTFVGPAGLLIVLLLLPASWLGKWVYST